MKGGSATIKKIRAKLDDVLELVRGVSFCLDPKTTI